MVTKTWLVQNVLFVTFLFAILAYLIWPQKADLLLICAALMWLNNLFYSLQYFRRRVIFFFFNITFFTFILGRPIIDWFQGKDWVLMPVYYYYKGADAKTAMMAIIVSLWAVWLGAIIGNQCLLKMHHKFVYKSYNKSEDFIKVVNKLSLLLFLASLSPSFVMGIEKIIFSFSHSYTEYYTVFQSKLPYLIYILSTFLEFSVCVYLATLPSKRKAFEILMIYVLSTVPDLIVGVRGPIVQAVIFSLIYYILRDFYACSKVWIGKVESGALLIGIPAGVVFLGFYNYIREGSSISKMSVFSVIEDFFYKQGVTFSWLSSGMGAIDLLPNADNPHYSLGWIIDYFRYGKLGQLITGLPGLGNGNNIVRATQGNSMAHHMSYILLGKSYLQGHGCGSSFLLETFADGGIGGVLIYSFLLGFLLIVLVEVSRYGVFAFSMVLCSIQGILILPRSEAVSCLQFIFRIPFWCVMCFCFIGALLLARKYRRLDVTLPQDISVSQIECEL